jgi:hypothetical protein
MNAVLNPSLRELSDILSDLRGAPFQAAASEVLHSPRLLIFDDMDAKRSIVLLATMFLHFSGIGRTEDLAKGIKAALDTQHY